MANKTTLRKNRDGTVINETSKKCEKRINDALVQVSNHVVEKFGLYPEHDQISPLHDTVEALSKQHPEVDFCCYSKKSHMRPDGGILSITSKDKEKYPILISEVKNQGTNDLRAREGKGKQARGNAIERLGKNVIGFRAKLSGEDIFPFICFGDGCDFAPNSSILDRVSTIGMFVPLNRVSVYNEGRNGELQRGSFFFREKLWTSAEMAKPMKEIVNISINYYFSKYGEDIFR